MAEEKQRPAPPPPAPARAGKGVAPGRPLTLGERAGLKVAPLFLRLTLGLAMVWSGAAMLMADLPLSGAQAEVLGSLGILDRPAPPESAGQEQPTLPRTDSEPVAPEQPGESPAPTEPAGAASGGIETVRQVHALTLRIREGAVGQASPEGTARRTLPAAAADRPWPSVIAHAVMSIELIAGFFVLIGFLTRISAWLLALVVGAGIWVADIGPAVAWGRTWLGFVPAYENFGFVGSGPAAYEGLFLHASLLAAALSLALLGAGVISADRLLRTRR